jgi:hypothetical protein
LRPARAHPRISTTIKDANRFSATTTTKQGTGWNGNEVTKKDIYKEGVTGSEETHSKTETDPASGGTTTSTTTTRQ